MKVVVKKNIQFPYSKEIKEGTVLEVIDLGGDMYKTEGGQLITKSNTQVLTWDITTLLNISRKFSDSLNEMNLSPDQKIIILSGLKSILKEELK